MAAGTAPIFVDTIKNPAAQFTSADTTAKKTVFTAGSDGARIDSLRCATDDTAAVNLRFYINDGATDFYIGVVALPAGTGYTTVVGVDAITTLAPLLGFIALAPGYILKAACLATMTAAKVTDVVGTVAGDY